MSLIAMSNNRTIRLSQTNKIQSTMSASSDDQGPCDQETEMPSSPLPQMHESNSTTSRAEVRNCCVCEMSADDEITVTAVFLETEIGPMPDISTKYRKHQFACDQCIYRCARLDILTAHKRLHDVRFREAFDSRLAQKEVIRSHGALNAQEPKHIDSNDTSVARDGRNKS
jgi:hypothetical protein